MALSGVIKFLKKVYSPYVDKHRILQIIPVPSARNIL